MKHGSDGVRSRARVLAILVAAAMLAALAGVIPASPAAAVPPPGDVLYGADSGEDANLLVLDPATGAVTETIGPIGFSVTGLAVDPTTGVLYGVTGRRSVLNPGHLITIDRTTGAGTVVGDQFPTNDGGAADITFTSDGTLYGWSENTDDLVTIDTATGAATVVGESGLSTYGSGLSADAADALYFAGDGEDGDLHTIDRTTGAPTVATDLTPLDPGNHPISALAFGCDGTTLYGVHLDFDDPDLTVRPTDLITIDATTGDLTVMGASANRLDAIEWFCPGTLSVGSATVAEGAGTAVVTVTRTGGFDGPATVDVATSDGTATAGSDYTATSDALSFAHGETSKEFSVPILDDSADEPDETINVTMSSNSGAAMAPGAGVITITDDDGLPSLSINDVAVPEPATGSVAANFTVTLSTASGNPVTVDFATANGTANAGSDYTSATGTLTFAPGETTKTVPVTVNGDAVAEGNETFTVTLSNATNATIADPTGVGTIVETAPGYWLVASDGGIFSFDVPFSGSTGNITLNQPIVGMAADPDGKGYWFVAADGGVFAFDATFHGSMGGTKLNQPIVGMAADPDGKGYWLVAKDGGIFSFDATFSGSTGNIRLNQPIVGMTADPDGKGYWFVASDGGVFAFDAAFSGSMGAIRLNQPVVGMAADPDGKGYWLVAKDGGIFSFDATFSGSTGNIRLNQPIVGMTADPDGKGYWFVASDGGVFAFDAAFRGSMGAIRLNQPVVGMAARHTA